MFGWCKRKTEQVGKPLWAEEPAATPEGEEFLLFMLEELGKELDALEERVVACERRVPAATVDLVAFEQLERTNRRYIGALQFYSAPLTWEVENGMAAAERDRGRIARSTLEATQETP